MRASVPYVSVLGLFLGALASCLFWNSRKESAPIEEKLSEERIGVFAEEARNVRDDADVADESPRPQSLDELREILTGKPSHRNQAALWKRIETLPFDQLKQFYLDAMKNSSGDVMIAAYLLERMVQVNPQKVSAVIADLDDTQIVEAVSALLPELAAIDPDASLDLYYLIDESNRDVLQRDNLLGVLAQVDLHAAIQVASEFEVADRGRAYGILVSSSSSVDPDGTIAFLKGLAGSELAGALGDLKALGRLASFDAEQTAGLIAALPMTQDAVSKFARLAEVWTAQKPEAALEWADDIQLEAVRSRALSAVYGTWVMNDRDGAFQSLEGIGDATLRMRLFESMATAVISNDPEGAASWARGLAGEDQSHALGLIGAELAAKDPVLAASYLAEAIEAGEAPLAKPSDAIGFAFALRDTAAAGEWAITLPEGPAREHVAAGIARAMVSSDPVAASEWIGSLPEGSARNRSVGHLVDGIRTSDPPAAFDWASSIANDPEKRFSFLSRAVDSWKMVSPKETRAAIRNLETISEDEKARLLRRVW